MALSSVMMPVVVGRGYAIIYMTPPVLLLTAYDGLTLGGAERLTIALSFTVHCSIVGNYI
jgi:hypothetical protein